MNSATLTLFVAWSAVAGGLIPVMAAMNGTLGRAVGSPIHAAFVLCVAGTLGVALTWLAFRPAMPPAASWTSVPWYAWLGGVGMACYALSATFLAPRFGVGNFVICVVVAQLVTSSLIDQFGLFGMAQSTLGLRRLVGLGVLGLGAVLVAWK
ncbi:MAG TPA: DMT family transporter [Hyphomonadaceae bacterium]|nr:DMT family transporter [Hyphomonadaceae bacterium]